MTESQLRTVVIGLGYVAQNIHLPILFTKKSIKERIKVVGIRAKTEESMKKTASKYKVDKLFSSLEEIADEKIDIAFVLSPKETHAEITKSLLQCGIDVFCEKPIATNLADAKKVVEIAKKHKRILMIGFNRRYAPVCQKAKEVFNENPPDVCFVEKNRPGTEYRATLENAIHMVDLMRYYCGEYEEVSGLSQYTDPYYETTTTAQIRFKNNSIGLLLANRSSGQWLEKIELYGQNKTVIVDFPERVTIQYHDHEETIARTPLAMGWAQATDRLGFEQEIEHFLECIKNRQIPITSGKEALKTHVLMDAILTKAGLPNLSN